MQRTSHYTIPKPNETLPDQNLGHISWLHEHVQAATYVCNDTIERCEYCARKGELTTQILSDVNKDWTSKNKDKDLNLKDKDKAKDLPRVV